jgi:hypothetical protein
MPMDALRLPSMLLCVVAVLLSQKLLEPRAHHPVLGPPSDPSPPGCPAVHRDAPWVAPALPEPITAIQPAPSDARWIAAWNDDHVFVSYDAGATFTRALDAAGHVSSASFDCWGRLIVARGNHLGVREDGRERWHELPELRGDDDAPAGVLGGGPDIVVVGNRAGEDQGSLARLATSSDAGATWTYRDLATNLEGERDLQGRQHADGRIELATKTGDCMNDDIDWLTIRGRGVESSGATLGEGEEFAIYDDLMITEGRWSVRNGVWNELALPDEIRRVDPVRGAFAVVVADTRTYRFEAGKLHPLPLVVEGRPQSVDVAGRIWSIACGKPLVAQLVPTGLPATCESP